MSQDQFTINCSSSFGRASDLQSGGHGFKTLSGHSFSEPFDISPHLILILSNSFIIGLEAVHGADMLIKVMSVLEIKINVQNYVTLDIHRYCWLYGEFMV